MPNIVFNICKYRKITCPNRLDVPVRKICVFALCIEYIRKETWYIFSSVNLNFDRFQLTKSGCIILFYMYKHRRTAANISYLFWIKRWPPYCTIKRLYNQTRVYNTVWYIFQGFNANCSQFSKIYIVMYHTHAKRFLEFSYKHEIVLMLSWIVTNLIFHHHTLNLHVNFSLKNSLKVSKELYEAQIHKRWLKLILITIVIIKVATKSCAFLPVQLLFPMFDA